MLAGLQSNTPATGAGVAFAGTIGVNFNVGQKRLSRQGDGP